MHLTCLGHALHICLTNIECVSGGDWAAQHNLFHSTKDQDKDASNTSNPNTPKVRLKDSQRSELNLTVSPDSEYITQYIMYYLYGGALGLDVELLKSLRNTATWPCSDFDIICISICLSASWSRVRHFLAMKH